MSVLKVKPQLIDELKDYGAFDVSSCFNCGTCTATCPLVKDDSQFPRQIIRLAQLGQKEKLLGSKELWACYYCGECSDSCPRDAQPGEFMAAARRYAIAQHDVTGISRYSYKHPKVLTAFLFVLAGLISLLAFLVDKFQPFNDDIAILGAYYYRTIHWVGMVAAFLLLTVVVAGTFTMYKRLVTNEPLRKRHYILNELPLGKRINLSIRTLLKTAKNEFVLQRRFKEGSYPEKGRHIFTNRWFVHMSISWGFIGLLTATALDFMVKDMILGEPGAWVPIYYPIRLLGIVSGLFLVWGTSVALVKRIRKTDSYYAHSTYSDWLFLGLLWGAGVSGFIVTILVYVPQESLPVWGHWLLVLHIIISAELLVMLPFTKFAHVIYRPIALWRYDTENRIIDELQKEESRKALLEREEQEGVTPVIELTQK